METAGSLAGTVLSASNRSPYVEDKILWWFYFYQQILLLQITESNKKSTKDLIKLVENTTLKLQNGELLLLKNLGAALEHSMFTQLL